MLHGVRAAALWERSGKTRADTGACAQAADFWSVLEAARPAENRDQRIRNAATLNAVEEPELPSVSCRACSSPMPTGLRLTAAVYEISPGEGHKLTCPRCGSVASYTKREFRISSDSIAR